MLISGSQHQKTSGYQDRITALLVSEIVLPALEATQMTTGLHKLCILEHKSDHWIAVQKAF